MKHMLRKVFHKLQWTILVFILLIVLVPASILGVYSYTQYSNIITSRISDLNQKNVTQMGENLETLFINMNNTSLSFYQNDDVRQYLMAADGEGNRDQYEAAFLTLDRFIQNKLAYEKDIAGVAFRRMDGRQYVSGILFPPITETLHRELTDLRGRARFVISPEAAADYYGYARCINDINHMEIPLGTMQIYIDQDKIQNMMKNSGMSSGDKMYIADQGTVIISTDETLIGQQTDELQGKKEYLYTTYEMKKPAWTLVSQMSIAQIHQEKKVALQMVSLVALVSVLISVFAAYFVSRSILKPVNLVATSMKHISEENFGITIPESGQDLSAHAWFTECYEEIGVLVHSFNKMSLRLDELVNLVYVSKVKEKDAEIRALQAYIDPHFLYNTLDTICWMSRMEHAYETCRLTEALSSLFRLTTRDTGRTVTVETELSHIRNYLLIQECRYTDMIDFHLEVDEDLLEYQTVRFVLQPIVENAIIHGIEPTGEPGEVKITVKKDGSHLIYMVENDGVDADVEEIGELLHNYKEGKRGLGICNVNDRIRLCFGETYGIQFFRKKPHGVTVVITQPLCRQGEIE